MSVLTKTEFHDDRSVGSVLHWGDLTRMRDPALSVIMPLYNRHETFKAALLSVINQEDASPYEIVVVDNTDSPAIRAANLEFVRSVACDRVLYYVNEENLGACGNWNRGIVLSRAPMVTFCHDDDLLQPDALHQLEVLSQEFPGMAIFTRYHLIDANGQYISRFNIAERRYGILRHRRHFRLTLYDFLMGNVTAGVGDLYYRKDLIEVGGYRKEFSPCFDYALNAAYAYHFGAMYSNVPTSAVRRGFNDTLNCFKEIPSANRRICEGIIEKLWLPQWLSRRIVNGNLNEFATILDNEFGERRALKLPQDLLLRCFRVALNLKKFTIWTDK